MSFVLRLFDPTAFGPNGRADPGKSELPEPAKEVRKQAIVRALLSVDPHLEVFQFDYDRLAAREGLSVEAARAKYRNVEMNSTNESIQIDLYDDSAFVEIPFSYRGRTAKQVFAKVWKYIRVIQQEAGYSVMDAQTRELVRSEDEFEDVQKRYSMGVGQLDSWQQ